MILSKTIKLAGTTLLLFVKSSQHEVAALGQETRALGETALTPTDDAFVWDGNKANRNYGSRDVMTLKKVSNSNRKAILKFDLDRQWDLSDVSATLRLYVDRVQSTASGSIQVSRLADSPAWQENSVTWNTITNVDVDDVGASFTVTGSDAGNWVEVDVSDLVRSSGGDTVNLEMEISNGSRCDFSSKEGTNPPQLVVTSGEAPTPSRVFTLGSPILSGTGCPTDNSVGISATTDGSKVTVMFQDYWADTENDSKSRVRKNCAISIPVSILPGFSIGIFRADYRGYVYVPDIEGMEATFNAEYFFAGTKGPKQTTTWFNGSEEDFTLTDHVAAVAYSPCGHAEHNLRINTSILAKGLSQQDGGSMIQIDTADITNPYGENVPLFNFNLYTKKCGSSNARMFQP